MVTDVMREEALEADPETVVRPETREPSAGEEMVTTGELAAFAAVGSGCGCTTMVAQADAISRILPSQCRRARWFIVRLRGWVCCNRFRSLRRLTRRE